ncbi:NAD-dependent protein deacetylase of SIR2 family [Streptomyces sp. NPDC004539]|uniref:NAD-dependent protein deacetylase of SIR2 family n=1 Tax=Streptomyces sp. NPDC004539 TaxID=3154280 RepID=UPI0033AACD68
MVQDTFRDWLDEADGVLVAAGAGLSAAAGYDYGDTDRFRELLPALHRLGLRSRYLLGVPLPPDMMWGYWAVHITDIRFAAAPNPLYRRLRELVGDRDHWVMTSNVDGLFARNGFDADRVFTPQGDYGFLQCRTPCTRELWPSGPFLDRVLAAYDRESGRVRDAAALPVCPNCGGEVFPNVRVGPEMVDDPYRPAGERLAKWLSQFQVAEPLSHSSTEPTPAARPTPTTHPTPASPRTRTLLVIEIGAGFNTPGVIRLPLENLVRHTPTARLIRVNPDHPEVPADLAASGRALPVPAGADEFLVP